MATIRPLHSTRSWGSGKRCCISTSRCASRVDLSDRFDASFGIALFSRDLVHSCKREPRGTPPARAMVEAQLRRIAMEARPYTPARIAVRETIAEGADMRVRILTLAKGECIPWHYHSEITDHFVCLEGPMVVETRAPRAEYRLEPGGRCDVGPKIAH